MGYKIPRKFNCTNCNKECYKTKYPINKHNFCTHKCYSQYLKTHYNSGMFQKGLKPWNTGHETIWEETTDYIATGYKVRWHKGKAFPEHHKVWIENNNIPIPQGCVVHHINGNRQDNRIQNLQLMPRSYHTYLHTSIRNSHGRLKLPEV